MLLYLDYWYAHLLECIHVALHLGQLIKKDSLVVGVAVEEVYEVEA